MELRGSGSASGATKIALAYILLSGVWIFTTDWLALLGSASGSQFLTFQTAKGLTFVTVSGGLIFVLVRREQRRLAAANADLERSLQHSSVLHRLLRHNLRNSCDVIQNSVDLLGSGRGDALATRDRIRRQTERLATIAEKTQHLRAVVFDEASGPVELDLSSTVQEAVTNVSRDHPEATIEVSIQPELEVLAHPRLVVAIEELVRNAVAHHEANAPVVTVSAELIEDGVVVRVVDDGPGLPQVEREVLEQGVEHTLAHSRGIGLWVVRFLVTASDGVLSVQSNGGDGTTVSIQLPAVAQ